MLIAKDTKEQDKQRRINRFGTPMTAEQIRAQLLPKTYIGQKLRYMSEKPNVELCVGPCRCLLPKAVPVSDGKDSQMMDYFEFGNYRFKFNGNEYVTDKILEQKAMVRKMGIICLGPIVESKPVKLAKPVEPAKVSSFGSKAQDNPPSL